MSEVFVLARRGLPLAGAIPSQPRAAWLPASARSPLAALPVRVTVMPAAVDEPSAESEAEWWPEVASITEPPGLAKAAPNLDDAHTDFALSPEAPVGVPSPHQPPMGPPSASQTDTTQRAVLREHDTPPSSHDFGAAASHRPVDPTQAAAAQVVPTNSGSSKQHDTSPARRDGSINTSAPAGDSPAQHLAAVTVTVAAQPDEPVVALPLGETQAGSQPRQATWPTTPAATRVQRHIEPVAPVAMGLPAVLPESSVAPAGVSAAVPDISVLLAPAPAPQRSVFIDRVSVTVQAPAVPPVPATPRAAPATSAPRGTATPGTFRNPWASYHLRRD